MRIISLLIDKGMCGFTLEGEVNITRSKVAVLKTSPENVIEDYKKLLSLAEMEKYLDKSCVTILKDNISWHYPYPGANTTPWQLEGVICYLKDCGFKDIVVVQNNTVVTNPFKGEKLNKYTGIFKRYGVKVLFNFRKEDMRWIKYKPKSEMLVLDKIYPKGIMIPDYFIGKNIVHLPTMKCHIYTTTTGAMKNAFGGLLNTKRHYTHSVIHETLVDLLKIQKEIHTGMFAVMDGTIAGNGPGPRTMIPVIKDYILASYDQVAIDAIASKMMGFDPMSIDYIKIADRQGLGNGVIGNIDVVGESIDDVNFGFKVGDNIASKFGDLLWFGPFKRIQKLFFHTPLVYIFILGSAVYHDYIWYPLKGKKIVSEFQKNTGWGKLFKSY